MFAGPLMPPINLGRTNRRLVIVPLTSTAKKSTRSLRPGEKTYIDRVLKCFVA